MKKLLVIVCLLCVTGLAHAETYFYKASDCAYKTNEGNGWSEWSDWEYSGILITMDMEKDIIKTNGDSPQAYFILSSSDAYADDSGGTQVCFECIDQEEIKCEVRLRIEENGNSQMYIDYADIMLVFNVERVY